jgi:hypothetical protein
MGQPTKSGENFEHTISRTSFDRRPSTDLETSFRLNDPSSHESTYPQILHDLLEYL